MDRHGVAAVLAAFIESGKLSVYEPLDIRAKA
jgi:hypothetical protein